MANPFLMTEEDSITPTDMSSNPFLIEDAGDTEEYMPENPFMPQGGNPFADFGTGGDDVLVNTSTAVTAVSMDQYPAVTSNDIFMQNEQAVTMTTNSAIQQPIDTAMSFFGTTISETDDIPEPTAEKPAGLNIFYSENMSHLDEHIAYSSDEELRGDKRLPPPRPSVPPSQTTQDLILSVADHLDQTSSHLLGRLPRTRTPSPVSIRDLHSPSPTPDVGDLLDVSDGQMINDLDTDFAVQNIQNDNPFVIAESAQIIRPEPARPPPPRPTPPRPSPPRRPPSPSTISAPASNQDFAPAPAFVQPATPAFVPAPASHSDPMQEDLFDMFDTTTKPKKPPPPKSNQDILNLFSAPIVSSVQAQPDLLSGDILSMDESALNAPLLTDTLFKPGIPPSVLPNVPPPIPNKPVQIITEAVAPVENSVENVVPSMNSTPSVGSIKSAIEETAIAPSSDSNQIKFMPPLEKENILDDVENTEAILDHSPADVSMYQDHLRPMTPSDQDDSSQYEHMDTTHDNTTVTPSPNPFASPEAEDEISMVPEYATAAAVPTAFVDPVVIPTVAPVAPIVPMQAAPIPFSKPVPPVRKQDTFDAFSAKFDSAKKEEHTLLEGFGANKETVNCAWGDNNAFNASVDTEGFGNEEGFDSFLAMRAPPAPKGFSRNDSRESDEGQEFNVVIRPRDIDTVQGPTPILAPPPPKSSQNNSIYSGDSSPRVNPFDKGDDASDSIPTQVTFAKIERTDSQETPQTPLFDDDVSQPLEDFPRVSYYSDGWEIQLRQPTKKKITGNRFWKKCWLKITMQGDNAVVQIYNSQKDKDPFQELPLQAGYSVSDISAQQYDQYGKIFTLKLQLMYYKERPGVRPGQVTKAERITSKLSKFAAYAIQGDYEGVKELGSDLKKLGLPVEHAPLATQLFKLGSFNYEDLKQFSVSIEEHLFKYNIHRDRALTYKTEEVQVTCVDELFVEQDAEGHVLKQIARVRLHFLSFLNGMPTIELGVNDLWRQGKEVVGRHDIIPVVTEEWIRLEGVEFHLCVQQDEYEKTRTIRFQPPDACYIELMRFRVRPPKNRELPLQLKATWCVTGNKVELRADVLVPGFASRKLGQIPCEDVSIRFPIPECWIYLFRVEKHFRYGSVKSAHRRTGKIKGIERILGTVDQLQESLIEVTSGQAKYEHHHRAIVWRCPRLPKEGQGAYTTHQLVVRMALTSYDQIPEQLAPYCFVEFTMPATQVSHVTVRSISVQDSDSDDPPEKYVRYLARHEYKVGIEHTTGETTNAYLAATTVAAKPKEEEPPSSLPAIAASDSGSDSD